MKSNLVVERKNLSDELTDGQYEISILKHLTQVKAKGKPKVKQKSAYQRCLDYNLGEIPF